MMKTRTSRLAMLVIVQLHLVYSAAGQIGHKCSGMGKRFCNGANFDAEECPMPCRRRNCDDVNDERIISNGASKYRDVDWIDIVDEGVWDNTYVYKDEVCYGVCWYKPWEAKCDIWGVTKHGKKYCKLLSCEHDEGSRQNNGDRYAGCHYSRSEGDENGRKKPWHKPTCEECYKVFPACRAELEGHLRDSQKDEIDVPRGNGDAHWRWDDRKYGDTRKYRGVKNDDDDDDSRSRDEDSSASEEKAASEEKDVSSEKTKEAPNDDSSSSREDPPAAPEEKSSASSEKVKSSKRPAAPSRNSTASEKISVSEKPAASSEKSAAGQWKAAQKQPVRQTQAWRQKRSRASRKEKKNASQR